jgi:hypothetical protein
MISVVPGVAVDTINITSHNTTHAHLKWTVPLTANLSAKYVGFTVYHKIYSSVPLWACTTNQTSALQVELSDVDLANGSFASFIEIPVDFQAVPC